MQDKGVYPLERARRVLTPAVIEGRGYPGPYGAQCIAPYALLALFRRGIPPASLCDAPPAVLRTARTASRADLASARELRVRSLQPAYGFSRRVHAPRPRRLGPKPLVQIRGQKKAVADY